jgi:hypothetical protein
MQETGVDFLVNHLIDCDYYLLTHSLEIEQAKKIEKQQAEEFAIVFAEWCLIELLDGNEPKAETMEKLLVNMGVLVVNK